MGENTDPPSCYSSLHMCCPQSGSFLLFQFFPLCIGKDSPPCPSSFSFVWTLFFSPHFFLPPSNPLHLTPLRHSSPSFTFFLSSSLLLLLLTLFISDTPTHLHIHCVFCSKFNSGPIQLKLLQSDCSSLIFINKTTLNTHIYKVSQLSFYKCI